MPYVSCISPDDPLRPIGTNFGLRVRLVDLINCAKFYRNRLRGLVWPFPLDCNVAINTGRDYCPPVITAYTVVQAVV